MTDVTDVTVLAVLASLGLAVPDAGHLDAATPVMVVVGNHLLRTDLPRSDLAGPHDATLTRSVPLDAVQACLLRRRRNPRLSTAKAEARARRTDLVTAARGIANSPPAGLTVGPGAAASGLAGGGQAGHDGQGRIGGLVLPVPTA